MTSLFIHLNIATITNFINSTAIKFQNQKIVINNKYSVSNKRFSFQAIWSYDNKRYDVKKM